MVGIDGSFTQDWYIKNISFSGEAGFSRSLYPPNSGLFYSTYNSAGEEDYNSGWFAKKELPFRYKANFSLKMDKKPFQLSASFPLMSDPTFKSDFLDRSEDLNWFKFLTEQDKLALGAKIGEEASYSWNLNGSIIPDMSFTSPYLKTLSISTLSGIMTFNSKNDADIAKDKEKSLYSPERKFFYPELIKPEVKLSLGGTIWSTEKNPDKKINKDNVKNAPDISAIQNPLKEQTVSDPKENTQTSDASSTDEKDSVDRSVADRFIPKAGAENTGTDSGSTTTGSINWSADPGIVQEMRYDATDWITPDKIDWNKYASSYYQFRTTAKLVGQMSYDSDFFSASSSLDFSGIKQEHPWLSETMYDTKAKKDTIYMSDYKSSIYTISTTDSMKLIPFNKIDLLKPISASWNFTGSLYQSEFDGVVDQPHWKVKAIKWDKDYITTHTATAVTGVSIYSQDQTITLTSNLPPLLAAYTGTSVFGWTFVKLTMNSRLYEKEDAYKKWFWDPYKANLTWDLPFNFNLGQEYIYDIEEKRPSRLNFTAGKGYLSAYYTINNTVPYKLIQGAGWVLDGVEPKFIPTAAGLSFNNASKPVVVYTWKNRMFLQAQLSSNLKFDLLKLTSSSFDFVPTLTFKLTDFIDISFSSNSTNDVIARYFQNVINLPAELPGEKNALIDLQKSFYFLDKKERSLSGFKLKSLSVEVTHYLHDWTANLKTTLKPELKTDGGYYYDFVPEVTFVVQWKPISDIKTTIKSKEGVFTLNTTDDTANK